MAAPRVYVNGLEVKFDVDPMLNNGRLLVPLRAIFESLEATVQWDPASKTITAQSKHGEILTLQIGNTTGKIEKNGAFSYINMDVPPQIINGRTLVPLRVVGESFNKDVSWKVAVLSAYIDDPKNFAHYQGEAEYYFNQQDWGKAVNWYTKAIELSPNDPELYYKNAYSEMQVADLQSALFNINKAISLKSDDDRFFTLRAAINEKLGNAKEALSDQQRAAELQK